jgi:type II secretory pathway pseudopilin PulG
MSEPAHGVPLLRNDRGIVLILTLMVIMVLSVLATAFLFLSGTEINISRNSQVVTQAFYAAEAGIDTAINQLPNTTAINQTALGVNNAVFQTGPPPPAPPAPAVALGPNPSPPAGFNLANFSFNMYQVDVSGTVLVPRSDMQLRVGATVGTPMAGTSY